jgi:hypothetical protein
MRWLPAQALRARWQGQAAGTAGPPGERGARGGHPAAHLWSSCQPRIRLTSPQSWSCCVCRWSSPLSGAQGRRLRSSGRPGEHCSGLRAQRWRFTGGRNLGGRPAWQAITPPPHAACSCGCDVQHCTCASARLWRAHGGVGVVAPRAGQSVRVAAWRRRAATHLASSSSDCWAKRECRRTMGVV